ncbi:hypothetical protein BKA57DRAFT_225553 [Linnemannia elongata]|nr:hypothetical protein BKA57DRAFT_225553 [Linnemannia elongata]
MYSAPSFSYQLISSSKTDRQGIQTHRGPSRPIETACLPILTCALYFSTFFFFSFFTILLFRSFLLFRRFVTFLPLLLFSFLPYPYPSSLSSSSLLLPGLVYIPKYRLQFQISPFFPVPCTALQQTNVRMRLFFFFFFFFFVRRHCLS